MSRSQHKIAALVVAAFATSTLSACAAPNQIASAPIPTTSSTRSEVQTKSNAKIEKPRVLKPSSSKTLTGQKAFGGFVDDAPNVRRLITVKDMPAPYHTESAGNGPRIVGRPAGALPQSASGFCGCVVGRKPQQPARNCDRAQRRYFRQRKLFQSRARVARFKKSRQVGHIRNLRRRLEAAVWNRVLADEKPAMGLRRQHRFGGAFSVSQRRFESARRVRNDCRQRFQRRQTAKRRPLDARHRVFARWQEVVFIDWFFVECR